MVKIAGLFAGIGGLELGLSAAGHQAEMLCEIWEPAQAVLEDRFPDVQLVSDIVEDLSYLPGSVDLIAAGFPCQDLSQAGTTQGIAGQQSGLVNRVFELLDRRPIDWVLLENVPFMLHLGRGKALHTIINALEDRDYRWAYRVVNSLAFLPQRRERVFLIATRSEVPPENVLLVDDQPATETQTSLDRDAHGFYWTEGTRGLGWAPNCIPTLKGGSAIGIPSAPAIVLPTGEIITPDIRDAERLQGFEPDWTLPATEVAGASVRWKLVGNAVSVPVARWLGNRLTQPGVYEVARDLEMPGTRRWPRAARGGRGHRIAVNIGSLPSWENRPALKDFLIHRGRPLSARAVRGFYHRITDERKCRLRFVPGFKDLIRAHLDRMDRAEAEGFAT